MALSDLLKDLDPKYASALSEITDRLRREFDDKLSATRAELGLEAEAGETAELAEEMPGAAIPPAEVPDPLAELMAAVVAVDAAGSQGEVLDSLVAGCARFASRCAIFLMRDGQVSGWTSHGFALSEDEMKAISFRIEPGSPWDLLAGGEGTVTLDAAGCGPLCVRLGAEAADSGLLAPFVLNNQTAAAVYCDSPGGDRAPHAAAVQLLTFIASQVLENLPVRDRESTSTLSLATATITEEKMAEPEPHAEPEPYFEPEPEPEPYAEAEAEAEPYPAVESGPSVEEAPQPLPAEETTGEEPVAAMEERAWETAPATEPIEPGVEEASPEPLMETEVEPEPPAPMDLTEATGHDGAPALEVEPEPAVTGYDATEPEPEAAEEAVDEEPPAPTLLSSATTQVAPPIDLEGPGWAFTGAGAAAPDAGDESQHEEARRLARLLVTEVKLYNEELVEEGRKNGNVYSVLKEDIDRSRQIFEDRIAEDVRSHSDYFHEALVRILAGGDPSVLGA